MEKISCNLCQSTETFDFMTVYDWYFLNGGPFNLVRCCNCGLTYLNPRPTGSELITYNHTMWKLWSMSEQSKEFKGSPKIAYQTYREIISTLKKLKPDKGKLLEVGSGMGGFLKTCQTKGWNVYGIDISDECVAYTKSVHGIKNTFSVDLMDAAFEENQFDVVILNHVIEHLAEPQVFLKEINRILKPSGLISISTPNIDSLSARVFGRYWQALFVPLHLTLFSPDTLTQMLQKTGYSILKISHYSFVTNAYDLLRSISCVLGILVLKLKKLLKGENNDVDYSLKVKSLKESRSRVIFRMFKPMLYFFVFPIVFFEGFIKRGASITIYASPNK